MLEEYRRCALVHAECDYSSKAAVSRANAAADRMRGIATALAKSAPGGAAVFETLLNDAATELWAAHHVLEVFRPGGDLEQRAVAVIQRNAGGEGASALGERMWLKQYEGKRGEPSPNKLLERTREG
jgi:hypothetical protein